MKRRRQTVARAGAAALAAVLLAGCGTGGTSEPDGSTGSNTPTAQPSEDDQGGG